MATDVSVDSRMKSLGYCMLLYVPKYSTFGGLFWSPAGSRRAASAISETHLWQAKTSFRQGFTWGVYLIPRSLLSCFLWKVSNLVASTLLTSICRTYGRRGYLDHAFTLHSTIFPQCMCRHALMNPVTTTTAFSGNFVNNGHRISIQLSNLCAMCPKGHS